MGIHPSMKMSQGWCHRFESDTRTMCVLAQLVERNSFLNFQYPARKNQSAIKIHPSKE